LEDFAYGFSLTEGIIASPDEIESVEIIEEPIGIELRVRLAEPHATAFRERRRFLAGPTGCGLCGIESLGEAMRTPAMVADPSSATPQDIAVALDALDGRQAINQTTRATHAAAYYRRGDGLVALREDVGRHNALDKLAGAQGHQRLRRTRRPDEPPICGTGAEGRRDRDTNFGSSVGADSSRRAHRGGVRHYAGGDRARRRL
jgi:formate dehydrogenase accessory protein FdhD